MEVERDISERVKEHNKECKKKRRERMKDKDK